jgi:seryl-tRNA synthetase
LKLAREKEIENMQELSKSTREDIVAEMEELYGKKYNDEREKYHQIIEAMKQDHDTVMGEMSATKLTLENEKNDLVKIHQSELEKKKVKTMV